METYFMCCFILLTSLVEVHSEQKVVHRGETVLLFANVTADSRDNKVQLYINGVKDNTLIATWEFENERLTVVSRNYPNIVMDNNSNIRIFDVDEHYTGKYSLFNSSRLTIELIVLDSSQTKSEHSSQNSLPWIVCGALVIVAIALIPLFSYVAHRKKCGKKIRPCHKRRHGNHSTPEEIEEDNEVVSPGKQQYVEELMEAIRPMMARLENQIVAVQTKMEEKESSGKLQYLEELKEVLRTFVEKKENQDEAIQKPMAEKGKFQDELDEDEGMPNSPRNLGNDARSNKYGNDITIIKKMCKFKNYYSEVEEGKMREMTNSITNRLDCSNNNNRIINRNTSEDRPVSI